jgi:hypothetical protein
MESYEHLIWPYPVEIGTTVVVVERRRSLDSGRTWHTLKTVSVESDPGEIFHGERSRSGPSMSGFWGNTNEIRSGSVTYYCSRFDGKRWRSMK